MAKNAGGTPRRGVGLAMSSIRALYGFLSTDVYKSVWV